MASTKPAAERKGWYHSDLVKVSPARLKFTGAIMPSKYDRPNWVPFQLDNGEEHTLEMENDGVEATVANAPRDVWLTVRAAGSRDVATIAIDGASSSRRQPSPPPDEREPDPEPPADWPAPAKPKLSRTMWDCMEKAFKIVDTFQQQHGREPTEAERAIGISLFIEKNRSNGSRDL